MKTKEETYLANVELWSHSHPKEAVWLQYFESDHLEIFESEPGIFNLRNKEKGDVFYQTKNPEQEARDWASSLNLDGLEVCMVFGVGLGAYYLPLRDWLKGNPDRHLVFFENDLEVIVKLFETECGTILLQDPQVSLYFFREVSEAEFIFNQIFWHFPMAKMEVFALKYYESVQGKTFDELKYQITYDQAVKSSLLEEYLQCGIAYYRNFYSNILNINEAYLGNALFGKLESIPAIICGAGPSLKNNIHILKKLSKKAVIFAGSSALNALANEGIKPHLGAGIDPNQMQEERLKCVKDLNFPFLYRNRLFPGALKKVTGPKLYVTGSGGYETSDWFEGKFQIEGKTIEEGRNVVNFCLEAAFEMGCNPIIFVGMDLAYTDKKSYAEGVVADTSVSVEHSRNEQEEPLVIKKDIFGNDIFTLWKWVSEAKWVGDFAALHPQVTLINATEGGLGFPGVPNQSLAQVENEYLDKEHEIASTIEKVYRENSLSRITKEQIVSAMEELKLGLLRCLEHLEILERENEIIKGEVKKEGVLERYQTGQAIMAEMELVEEPGFTFVLQIFNDVASKLMQRDLNRIHNPANKSTEIEKELEKLELNQEKYKFLSNVAKVNIELITHALKEG